MIDRRIKSQKKKPNDLQLKRFDDEEMEKHSDKAVQFIEITFDEEFAFDQLIIRLQNFITQK